MNPANGNPSPKGPPMSEGLDGIELRTLAEIDHLNSWGIGILELGESALEDDLIEVVKARISLSPAVGQLVDACRPAALMSVSRFDNKASNLAGVLLRLKPEDIPPCGEPQLWVTIHNWDLTRMVRRWAELLEASPSLVYEKLLEGFREQSSDLNEILVDATGEFNLEPDLPTLRKVLKV